MREIRKCECCGKDIKIIHKKQGNSQLKESNEGILTNWSRKQGWRWLCNFCFDENIKPIIKKVIEGSELEEIAKREERKELLRIKEILPSLQRDEFGRMVLENENLHPCEENICEWCGANHTRGEKCNEMAHYLNR